MTHKDRSMQRVIGSQDVRQDHLCWRYSDVKILLGDMTFMIGQE